MIATIVGALAWRLPTARDPVLGLVRVGTAVMAPVDYSLEVTVMSSLQPEAPGLGHGHDNARPDEYRVARQCMVLTSRAPRRGSG
jgi:hypothetical protein